LVLGLSLRMCGFWVFFSRACPPLALLISGRIRLPMRRAHEPLFSPPIPPPFCLQFLYCSVQGVSRLFLFFLPLLSRIACFLDASTVSFFFFRALPPPAASFDLIVFCSLCRPGTCFPVSSHFYKWPPFPWFFWPVTLSLSCFELILNPCLRSQIFVLTSSCTFFVFILFGEACLSAIG